VDAVAADHDLPFHRLAIAEHQPDFGFVLLEADAVPAEMNPLLPKPGAHRFQQNGLQVRAMDRELRPRVSRAPAERFLVDELAEAVEEHTLRRFHANARQRGLEAKSAQDFGRVRQQVDAHADRLDLGRGLEEPEGNAATMKLERQRQAADAGADDQNVAIHARFLDSARSRQRPN
jgi:hypothetical protein